MKIEKHPYHWLLIAAVIFLLLALYTGNETVDIHLHDTYYVLPAHYFSRLPILILVFFWFVYRTTANLLSSAKLSAIHIGMTIASCILLTLVPMGLQWITAQYAGQELVNMADRAFTLGKTIRTVTVIVLAFVTSGQLVYIINLFLGLRSRPTNKQL